MLFRVLWVSVTGTLCIVQAYLSVKNNTHGGGYTWIMFLVGLPPIWAYVASKSDRLVFDGILYDVVTCVVYAGVMSYLMRTSLSLTNWVGVGLAVLGLILVRL